MSASPRAVPDEPVVLVEVDALAGTVRLDGEPLEVPAGADPCLVGLHAAAWQIAHVLGRPVRTLVRTGDEQTWWVARPDGSADALRRPPAPAPVAVPLAPTPPPPPSRSRRLAPRVAWLVGTAAALTLVGTLVTVLALGDDGEPGEAAPRTTPTAETSEIRTEPSPAPVLAASEPAATVTAHAVGGVERIRLVIAASARPARVRLVLTPTGDGTAIVRTVRLTERRQVVELADLRAGGYRWRITAPGVAPAIGRVRVSASLPPETPPTSQSSSQSTTPTTPAPTPTQQPTQQPGQQSTGGGNGGSKNGKGDGPDSPVGSSTQAPDPDSPVPND